MQAMKLEVYPLLLSIRLNYRRDGNFLYERGKVKLKK